MEKSKNDLVNYLIVLKEKIQREKRFRQRIIISNRRKTHKMVQGGYGDGEEFAGTIENKFNSVREGYYEVTKTT